jgi:hypothetical protein
MTNVLSGSKELWERLGSGRHGSNGRWSSWDFEESWHVGLWFGCGWVEKEREAGLRGRPTAAAFDRVVALKIANREFTGSLCLKWH